MNVQNRLPFLDVHIDASTGKFITKVYRKPSDVGRCLNASSECPNRYKLSVIRSFIRRAFRTCSDWILLDAELKRIRQVLVNNGFSNRDIDSEILRAMRNAKNEKPTASKTPSLKIFYLNQMSQSYKVDERAIRDIISSCVTCTDKERSVTLIIYYKNQKVRNLFMKNNATANNSMLKRTNVVYLFSCPEVDCRPLQIDYVGATTTTLSRRLTMHLADGAPKAHMKDKHKRSLTRADLTENTSIIASCTDQKKLFILEALVIRERSPSLNVQAHHTPNTLQLFS